MIGVDLFTFFSFNRYKINNKENFIIVVQQLLFDKNYPLQIIDFSSILQ